MIDLLAVVLDGGEGPIHQVVILPSFAKVLTGGGHTSLVFVPANHL